MGSGRRSATMSITLRPNLNFATKADNTSVNWDELKGRLSSFQVDKLTYFFTQFFDHNQDGVTDSKGDLQRDLQQRRRADHQSVVSQELLRKLHRTVWRHPGESF